MFNKKTPDANLTNLTAAINRLLEDIIETDTDHDDYPAKVANLEQLYKLKDIDRPERVSRNTLVTVGGQLVGIALIVEFERLGIITSKAGDLLSKLR